MPAQNLNTGRLIQPYGGDPSDKITSGLAGLGAAMLQVGQFMQSQAARENYMRQSHEMELKRLQGERDNDMLQMKRDNLKLQLDQLAKEKAMFEAGERETARAITEFDRQATYMRGMSLGDIEDAQKTMTSIVAGAQFRSTDDLMSQLISQTMIADQVQALKDSNADDNELKAGLISLAREQLRQLELGRVERTSFGAALPVRSSLTRGYMEAQAGDPGFVGPTMPGTAQAASVVPKPPLLPGLPQGFFDNPPATQPAGRDFVQQFNQALLPIIRRDRRAGEEIFNRFIHYFNAVRPGGQPLTMAHFNLIQPE
jgi:hypothetical protein